MTRTVTTKVRLLKSMKTRIPVGLGVAILLLKMKWTLPTKANMKSGIAMVNRLQPIGTLLICYSMFLFQTVDENMTFKMVERQKSWQPTNMNLCSCFPCYGIHSRVKQHRWNSASDGPGRAAAFLSPFYLAFDDLLDGITKTKTTRNQFFRIGILFKRLLGSQSIGAYLGY